MSACAIAQADVGRYFSQIFALSHPLFFFFKEYRLTLSQTSPGFLRVCNTGLLKTLWEKEKLLVTSNFSFSHSVFYPFGELSAIFNKFEIVVSKLFEFGRFKNLSFGKELNERANKNQLCTYQNVGNDTLILDLINKYRPRFLLVYIVPFSPRTERKIREKKPENQ